MALPAAFAVAAVLAGSSGHAAPASPITVVKSPSASQVASGQQLKYTIVVTNTGGAAISNVVMTDQVNGIGVIQNPPALPQFTITSTKGSCTQGGANGNLITCNAGNMAGGESWTVTIGGQVTAGAGTTLNNTATVTGTKSSQTFTTPSNATQVLVTSGSTGGQPDLTINKTGPTSVTVGAAMTYTLTVNNIGNANATNIKVVDTLPAGVGFVSTSTTSLFTCASAGTPVTVTCTGGAVNAGQNGTITINATAPGAAGQITNTAVVDPDNTIAESNELNNTSAAVNTSVGGTPPPPLLSILKTDGNPVPTSGPPGWWTGAGPDPVNPGQKLTYKIFVQNNATGTNSTAGSVAIVDSTQGLDASSIVATQTVVNGALAKTDGCVVSAPQVKCTVKTLNSGGTITVTIVGTVLQSAGSTIFNTATVTGNVKNTGVTNTASEATTVRPAIDLTITKASDPNPVCARSWPTDGTLGSSNDHLGRGPGILPPGTGAPTPLVASPDCLHGLNYTFVVGNSGNANATGVVVRDPLPAGEIFDSYDAPPDWSCDVDALTQIVTCNGPIPAASTKTLTFKVVAPPNVGTITNTATVDPNNAIFESDETNNTVSATTAVVTGVDLVVWKGDGGSSHQDPPGGAPPLTEGFDPIATSGTDTYTIVVDDVGTQDTTGIKVVDTLPAGTKFLSATTDGAHSFTCSSDGALTVTCVGGQLKGTESEFYAGPGILGSPKDDFAIIKIKIFATPFVQPAMHNVVVVDPDNTIPEANELNNSAVDDTVVQTGNDNIGAFNQLTVAKTQASPAGTVATNGKLLYDLRVDNLGTDPVSNVVVKDFLPTGTRFISAVDSTGGPPSAAFFCSSDGAATGGVVTCTGGDFSGSLNTIPLVGITRHITLTVFAPAAPGQISNHVTVDPDNIVPEGNEFDNDAFTTTNVDSCVDLASCTSENAFNELTIQKTQVSPANPVARNGIVTYDLKVSNLGSDPVHNVTTTDRLPAGFRFIDAKDTASSPDPNSFTCGGPDSNGVVTCNGGSLSGQTLGIPTGSGPAPTFRTIRIRVFAPDTPGTYTNDSFVDPNNTIPEGNENNNQSSVETDVANGGNGPYIDLSLKKDATKNVIPGGQITYTLTVSNGGSGDAFNVAVRDVLPANLVFQSAQDNAPGTGAFTCNNSSGIVNCTGGTVKATSSRVITILANAPSNIEPFVSNLGAMTLDITNQASVDPDNTIPEGDETNNTASATTTVAPALDLQVSKDGPDSTTQNSEADYNIKVTDDCSSSTPSDCVAKNVTVHDPLPVGMIVLNVTTTDPKFACQVQQNPVNVVDCLGTLDSTNKDVTITVHVFMTLDKGSYTNVACVDVNDTIQERDETNNCSTKITNVTAPDLEIKKTAVTDPVTVGQTEEFDLHVANIGTANATGVTVHDSLDPGLDYVNATGTNGFTCSFSSPDVTCTGDLNAGSFTDIQIQTKVNSSATNPIGNTATVDAASGETNTGNNSSSVTVSLGAAAVDLVAASNLDTPDPANPGQVLTYKSTVLNNGTAPSGTFDITQSIPAGVAAISAVATNGFTCTLASPVDCSGSLNAGDNTTLTIKAIVTATPPATLTSTLTADSGGVVAESDETNNTKDATTTVTGASCSSCMDLTISDIVSNPADPATIPADGTTQLTYTFAVANVGDTKVTGGATIENQLDPNVTLVSATGTNGYTCFNFLGDVICSSGTDLQANQGTVITIVVTVNSGTGSGTTITDSAKVDQVAGEFSTANNGPKTSQIKVQ